MNIFIDDQQITVTDSAKNIVDIAADNGIVINAPCYRSKKRAGCCRACLIEVDGEQSHACATRPHNDMRIVYQRTDLAALRKERMAQYAAELDESTCDDKSQVNNPNDSCACSANDRTDNTCCSENDTNCCTDNTGCA